jgi:uncharacterized cupin superfamily protein
MKIQVEKPIEAKLQELQVEQWPVWECAPSEFDWHYDQSETCYLLEGQVTVKTATEEVAFGKGDLVIFPAGLSCTWKVREKVKKHYRLG